ncbi:MAG: hypothetical protein ACKO37_04585 [Vampirovibrionales bacterium]
MSFSGLSQATAFQPLQATRTQPASAMPSVSSGVVLQPQSVNAQALVPQGNTSSVQTGLTPSPQAFLSPTSLLAQQGVQPATATETTPQAQVSSVQSPQPQVVAPQTASSSVPSSMTDMSSGTLVQKIPTFLAQLTALITQGLQAGQQQGSQAMAGEFVSEQGQTHQFQITMSQPPQSAMAWLQSQGLPSQTPVATMVFQPPIQQANGQTIQQVLLPLGGTSQGVSLPLVLDAQGQATMPTTSEGFQSWLLPLLTTLATPPQAPMSSQPSELSRVPSPSSQSPMMPVSSGTQEETTRFSGEPSGTASTQSSAVSVPTQTGRSPSTAAVPPSSSSAPVQPSPPAGKPASVSPRDTTPQPVVTPSVTSLPPATVPPSYQVIFPSEPTPYGLNPERRIPVREPSSASSSSIPSPKTANTTAVSSPSSVAVSATTTDTRTTPSPVKPSVTEAIELSLPDGSGDVIAKKAPDEKESLFTADHPRTKEPLFFTLKQDGKEQVAVSLRPTTIKDLDDTLTSQADPVARKHYRQFIRNESGKLMSRFIDPQEHLGLWAYPVMQWARLKVGPIDLASDSAKVKEYLEAGKALDTAKPNANPSVQITPQMERDFLRINRERTYRGGASPLYISDIYAGLQTAVKTKSFLDLAETLPTSRHLPSAKIRQTFKATLEGFKPNADTLDADQRWNAFRNLVRDTKAVDDAVASKPPKLEDVVNQYKTNAQGLPDITQRMQKPSSTGKHSVSPTPPAQSLSQGTTPTTAKPKQQTPSVPQPKAKLDSAPSHHALNAPFKPAVRASGSAILSSKKAPTSSEAS